MDHAARVAYINAQTVCASAEIAGMVASNMIANGLGNVIPYGEGDFENIPVKYGIAHNQVITYLQD